MKPNWSALAFVALFVATLSLTVLVASLAAVLHIVSWMTGRSIWGIDAWLALVTMLTLGILIWPGLLAILRVVTSRKPDVVRVERKPVGSVVIALVALNEEQAIEEVVRDFQNAPGVGNVIVVDNGSTDRTNELAKRAGAQVVQERQQGYGYSCIRALSEGLRSGADVIVLCEADRTFVAADLEQLIAYLNYADLVVGSRTNRILLNSDSQLTSFLAIGNSFVAKLLEIRYWDWKYGSRVRVTDVGCTYRAIRADGLQRILPALEVGRDHFSPHMMMVALEHGLRLIEIPVTFWKRLGVSKGGNANWRKGFILGLKMIWHILTYRVRVSTSPARSPTESISHVTSS